MTKTRCVVCGTEHAKEDGVVTVTEGKEWRFCSESCRTEWKDA